MIGEKFIRRDEQEMVKAVETKLGLILTGLVYLVSVAGCFDSPLDVVKKINFQRSHWIELGSIKTFSSSPWGYQENSRGDIFIAYRNSILLSENGGRGWEEIYGRKYNNNYIVSILVDRDTDYIYAAVLRSGIFRSTDNGKTWQPVNNHLSNAYIKVLLINPRGTIFAISRDGDVYESHDRGEMWAKVGNVDGWVHSGSMDKHGNIFLHSDQGIFKSCDGGRTWEKLATELRGYQIDALDVNEEGEIFIGGEWGKVYRSSDGGDSWEDCSIGGEGLSNVTDFAFGGHGIVYAVTRENVFRSLNGGRDWNPLSGVVEKIHPVNIFISSRGRMFVGAFKGLFYFLEEDGLWVISGDYERYINKIFVDGNSHGRLFALADGDLFGVKVNNGRAYFGLIKAGSRYALDACIGPGGTVYFLVGELLYRSSDGGCTWSLVSDDSEGQAIAVDSSGTLYVCSNRDLYRSRDGGVSWEVCFTAEDYIQFACPLGGGLVFAVTYNKIYRSSDSGSSWKMVREAWGVSPIKRTDDGTLYTCAHCHEGVLVSYDDGETWEWTAQADIPVTLETIDVTPDGHIVAASKEEGYIFYSDDGGESWIVDEARFPGVSSIVIDGNGYVYMVVYRKIYGSTFSVLTKVKP